MSGLGSLIDLLGSRVVTQAEFAELIGLTEGRVSQLAADGVLPPGHSVLAWLRRACERLREQAAGRDNDGSLARERAALAKEQRIGQAIKNAVAQGEYAPIGLLGDVLGLASAAVSERLDALGAQLKTVWPEMPNQARTMIEATVAAARNEWVAKTAELVDAKLEQLVEDEAAGAEAPLP